MAQIYAKSSNIPLAVAVFLASDKYEYNDDPFTISVTTLMRPIRQIVLSSRTSKMGGLINIMGQAKSSIGAAIHDGIEDAWVNNYRVALDALGYPEKVIERIRINPKPEDLTGEVIPIYLEQRVNKQVGKWTVSGKFDFVGEGIVQDFKSTSTYTYTSQSNAEKYPLQGSLYRWLNPGIITEDYMLIHYIFTDWKAGLSWGEKYPSEPVLSQKFMMHSISETEAYVKNKLDQLELALNADEKSLPLCSDEDLWRSDPVFKYYRNPEKTKRSTKNFDNHNDAMAHQANEGNVGIVIEKPGQVKACAYCAGFALCTQKDALIASGDLVL